MAITGIHPFDFPPILLGPPQSVARAPLTSHWLDPTHAIPPTLAGNFGVMKWTTSRCLTHNKTYELTSPIDHQYHNHFDITYCNDELYIDLLVLQCIAYAMVRRQSKSSSLARHPLDFRLSKC